MSQQQRLEQLAQKLGECSQCLKQGQNGDALSKLQDMQSDLANMQAEMAEGELLDQAMDEIAAAKDALNCKECNGQGCQACQGAMSRMQQGRQIGRGIGRGRGGNNAPEEGSPTQNYDSAVKQKVGRGAATIVGDADGANLKGGVREEIAAQVEAARAEAADPLTGQRLPKSSEEHAREYFNGLREGKP
ncbi:MAG: hypothetical protein JNG90_18685 [Planctomycetaceae bacterium]|nr:hypothetical protein [Planctomycetaceae bacterium]